MLPVTQQPYVTIAKQFTFDAAHFLPTVPEDHKCRRMHGHTYGVELRFCAQVRPSGFCGGIDYGDIATVWDGVFKIIDHRVLNDIPGLEVPSTEVLVQWIAKAFKREASVHHEHLAEYLRWIRVAESSTTWCELEVF